MRAVGVLKARAVFDKPFTVILSISKVKLLRVLTKMNVTGRGKSLLTKLYPRYIYFLCGI